MSGLFYYLNINEAPERTIYLPEIHSDILTKIIGKIGLNRKTGTAFLSFNNQENTMVRSKIRPEWGHALMFVSEFGADFERVMKALLREIKNQKISSIYTDLPLGNPLTPLAYSVLEVLGFSFSCFIPEYEDGDVIRLQYLNNCVVDPDKISVAAEFGKELLAYIMADLKN
jgi:serine/threonine-protein kinase RsbW